MDKKKKEELKAAGYIIGLFLAFMGFLAFLVVMYGCQCPRICRPNVTDYPISKKDAVRTPLGAYVIPTENVVDDLMLADIDNQITEVEICLKDFFWNYKDTLHKRKWNPPERHCYVIYLVADWRISCEEPVCQIFSEVSPEACALKGFVPKEGCVCGLRGVIQDGKHIVITPDLYFLKIQVVEFLTGYRSNDIWETPKLIECGGF